MMKRDHHAAAAADQIADAHEQRRQEGDQHCGANDVHPFLLFDGIAPGSIRRRLGLYDGERPISFQ